ncbi:MAG: hypothetical protein EAX81_03790 [Candidatus Thorarchaeota archaeon]|nr:hypothetical protein [Candidatus Thorarchaeota archaeon]
MTKEPLKLIDEYLERVKVYLPIDSGEILEEIRTHLIESAEAIGNGTMTQGSTIMAIERMGEPQAVANEYAGSGKKVGPVPAEYAQPVFRMLLVLIGVCAAFLVGAYVVGSAFLVPWGIIGEIENFPASIPIMLIVNILFVLLIIGGISLADRDKMPQEKTRLEGVFGIGTEGFKPKARTDAAGEIIFGILFGVIALHPAVQVLYSTAFVPFVGIIAALVFVDAIKGGMFLVAGENSLNLIIEALIGIVWIVIAMALINVGWPTDYFYGSIDGVTWGFVDLEAFFIDNGIPFFPFDWIWIFIIFVLVVTNTWRVIVDLTKVAMYFRSRRDLWWHGDWGKRQHAKGFRHRLSKHYEGRDEERRAYEDGYQGN